MQCLSKLEINVISLYWATWSTWWWWCWIKLIFDSTSGSVKPCMRRSCIQNRLLQMSYIISHLKVHVEVL